MNRSLRFLETVLLEVGTVLLVYVGALTLDARLSQAEIRRQFERADGGVLLRQEAATGAATEDARGRAIGRLRIERLDMDVMVLEGTAPRTLRRGAGHISWTSWLGEGGNVGIAAHRDTFFRPLEGIRPGDTIRLEDPTGTDRMYRVRATRVVRPEDVHVLESRGREQLTLVTCYPFSFIGPAPERFIVEADRARGDYGSSAR